MESAQVTLRLREDQIHSGMVVLLCLEEKKEPEKDESGELLMLQALLGAGNPFNAYLYPAKDGIRRSRDLVLSSPMSGFNPNVRFQPINVYKSEDAPCEEKYVVFVDGEYLLYEGMKKHPVNRVYLLKDGEGRLRNNGFCLKDGIFSRHEFEFPLPEGALLVSLDEVKKLRKGELVSV